MQHSVEKGLFIQGSQYSFESVHLHRVQYAFFYSYAKNRKEQEGEVAGSFEFPSSRGCCESAFRKEPVNPTENWKGWRLFREVDASVPLKMSALCMFPSRSSFCGQSSLVYSYFLFMLQDLGQWFKVKSLDSRCFTRMSAITCSGGPFSMWVLQMMGKTWRKSENTCLLPPNNGIQI